MVFLRPARVWTLEPVGLLWSDWTRMVLLRPARVWTLEPAFDSVGLLWSE